MDNELYQKFENYLKEIDVKKIESTWEYQSKIFKDFWKEKILNLSYPPLTDAEIDQVVLILDKNAKGSTKNTIAVARVMIPQGVWRRLFKEIQTNKKLQILLYNILIESDETKLTKLIDELYNINQGKKNSLTGKSGNAINAMLFAFSPKRYTDIISLNDRKRVIEYFNIECNVNFENDSQGKKIVQSNQAIISGFKKYKIDARPFILSDFLYNKIKDEWKPSEQTNQSAEDTSDGQGSQEDYSESKSSFYMEKELENFLITNWDRTELAKELELIEEEGEIVSQQYQTDIGKIDILVKDKKTGQYVVIELKKNQTSDDTVGQLTRYMGWLEEHKTNGKSTKGIIIASAYDKKLYYALKKVKDVEVYTYQVDFKLKEFKK